MLAFCTLILAQILTFQEAQELALEKSPDLQVQADQVGMRIGDHTQAMQRPNPIFTWEVENVLGNREWQGWGDAKSQYDITQPIETAGKRCWRMQAAAHAVAEAEERLEVARLIVLNRLKKLFIETAGAQERVALAEKRVAGGEEILRNLQTQIQEGKGKTIQLQKVKVELASDLFAYENSKEELKQVREELALQWGAAYPEFECVCFDLYNLEEPYTPPEGNFQDHPLLQQGELRRMGTEAFVQYQKALAVPDILFTVGYKVEGQNRGMTFGLAFPLPFFNRNQGNILRSEFEEQSAITEHSANQNELHTRLRMAIKQRLRNFKEAIYLRDHILEAAKEAYQLTLEGANEGKNTPLEVLELRQIVYEMEEKYLTALIRMHQAQVDIDYLIPSNPGAP